MRRHCAFPPLGLQHPPGPAASTPRRSLRAPSPSDPPAESAAAPVVPSGRGTLTVSAIPRAQVIVDGRFVRYTPLFQHDVDAGGRVVTLITDDGRRTTFTVEVPGGGDARRVWSFDEGRFIQR